MNKLIAFQKPNFQGISMEFTSTQKDLLQWNFNLCIASMKIIGQPWMCYEDQNCVGDYNVYEEGDYPEIQQFMSIQSIELVSEDLTDPSILLYMDKDTGKEYTAETNLKYGLYEDKAIACLVKRGAWILYEDINVAKSKYIVVRQSPKKLDLAELYFQNIVSYIRPLKPGHAKVSTEVLWDNMKKGPEIVEKVQTITGNNYSALPTEFVLSTSNSVEASSTYTFKSSTSVSIEVGLKAEVPLIAEVSTNISSTFSFDTGRSESSTVTTTVEVEVPAFIPGKSKLLVHVMRKKFTASVPVKVIVERNNTKSFIMGELVCDSGRTIYAEYETLDL